jgi:hypothetical protein
MSMDMTEIQFKDAARRYAQRHPGVSEEEAKRIVGEALECAGFFDLSPAGVADIVFNVVLDRLNPPTFDGKVLIWSGDGRVPDLGEDVEIRPELKEGLTYPNIPEPKWGMVVGYFRAQTLIGVQVRLEETGETVCFLGEQIDVAHEPPSNVVN